MAMEYDVIVIGAGAGGMMAAGRAAECGAKVLLLEKTAGSGNKLLISGKGRSNITNIEEDISAFISKFGSSGKFLYNAFSKFFNKDLISFFNCLGVPCVVERGGRVFPQSQKATSIVDALTEYMRKNNVAIIYNAGISEVLIKDREAYGVKTQKGRIFEAKKVILATGGRSYPRTGSTGDGYAVAARLGHHIIEARPSLVPLETEEGFVKELQGLTLENVKAKVLLKGKKQKEEFGDLIFTHFGLSGPIILTLSRDIFDLLGKGKVEISIDLKPALDEEKLKQRLIREFTGKTIYKNALKELLPSSMIPVFVRLSKIDPEKQVNQISAAQRNSIIRLLKDFRLTVNRIRPIEEAIVTRGGVSTREIDPQTMESKLIKGLYFCGEVIDIDAMTGGYNLQAAFSTGWVAGENAARD